MDSDDSQYCTDRSYLIGTGPFNIAVGDSQEIIIAYVVGQGNDALDSITKLKEQIPLLLNIADIFFEIETQLNQDFGFQITDTRIVGDNYNDDRIANNGETVKLEIDVSNSDSKDFKNVLIRSLTDGTFINGEKNILFPNINGNSTFSLSGDKSILLKAGDNSTDKISHQLVFFDSTYSTYQTIPYSIPIQQLYFTPMVVDTIHQIAGIGDGLLGFRYVDPYYSTSDTFKVEVTSQFYNAEGNLNDGLGIILTNLSTGNVLLDHYLLPTEYGFEYPTTNGYKLILLDTLQTGLNHLSVVENAGGILDPPVDCVAWWALSDYLVGDGTFTNQQALSDAVWLLNLHPYYMYDPESYGQIFFDNLFSMTGGFLSQNRGIDFLCPDDIEFRFTGNGKAIDYSGDQRIVDVPFECWNVKHDSDPSDDYKLICYFSDQDSNHIPNLQYGTPYFGYEDYADHPISPDYDDPWMDWLYILSPTNDSPGTEGHDNFINEAVNNPVIISGDRRYSTLPRRDSWSGENDPGGPLDAWNVLTQLCFVLLNGGNVSNATSPADYTAEYPELGTVFRITTNKPITVGDTFTFTTQNFDIEKPEEPKELPESFKLYQNYPNPFNNMTNIQYDIKDPTDLNIKIYNILGQQIFQYDIKQHPPGNYTLKWNGKTLEGNQIPSGVYIVTMNAGDYKQSKKLLLLK